MKALPIAIIGAIVVAVALALGTRRDPLEFPRGGLPEPPITLPKPEGSSPFIDPIEVRGFLPPGTIEGGLPFPITPTLTVVPPQGVTGTVVLTDPIFGEQIAFGDASALEITPPVADSLCLTPTGWKPCGFAGVTQTIAGGPDPAPLPTPAPPPLPPPTSVPPPPPRIKI